MKFISSMLKIEALRLRNIIILAAISLVMLILWLGMDITSMSNINLQYESFSSSDSTLGTVSDLASTETLIGLSSILIPASLVLGFISLLTMIIPFRGTNEWHVEGNSKFSKCLVEAFIKCKVQGLDCICWLL